MPSTTTPAHSTALSLSSRPPNPPPPYYSYSAQHSRLCCGPAKRTEKKDLIDPNNTRRYYYNNKWQVLCEYNDSDVLQQWFVYGNYIDEVIMMKVGADYYQYTHDHLYSTVALIDLSGATVLERYEYDAYGNPYILEPNFADDPDGQSDYGNPYLFTGRRVDTLDNGSLKIQYNRNRYYDYYTGRWLTHDPLGVSLAESSDNIFAAWVQYVHGENLYEYVKSSPLGKGDPFGLWEWDVHLVKTQEWAEEKEMCFAAWIGTWANAPDTDERAPVRGGIIASARVIADIIRRRDPLSGPGGAALREIARWHFPGGDEGQPVTPGSSLAKREVEKGIDSCNLQVFAEGLHQLQDSYSHQSNGLLPPWQRTVGHSRDRHGFYNEHWNDPHINPIPARLDRIIQGWAPAWRNWALKVWRKYTVLLSHDADSTSIFASTLSETKSATKEQMERFLDECTCIEDGPFKDRCMRCPRP
jgi:RHS repeat-associated protein